MTLLFFALGLALLVGGAEALVRGAVRLAAAGGVSPLVIGLTVVAYGTSAPELAVSLKAAFTGQANIALGNVVGSNIFNVLFILGISAAIAPLTVHRQLLRFDLWVMLVASALMYVLGRDGRIGRLDGLLLTTGAVGYTVLSIWQSRRENADVRQEFANEYGRPSRAKLRTVVPATCFVLLGLGLLIVGARWLVAGAVGIATAIGVSELVIALTIVAAGTSLPEVATSIVAAVRGERDIAVGNVVGSCIFNILAVLGCSAAVGPEGVRVGATALQIDIPVMVLAAAACLPIFYTAHRIDRWEGWLLLGGYGAYIAFLAWSFAAGAAGG